MIGFNFDDYVTMFKTGCNIISVLFLIGYGYKQNKLEFDDADNLLRLAIFIKLWGI